MINKNKHKRKIDLVKHPLEEWHDNLCSSEDRHSICSQVCNMLWKHTWYRTLNHSVGLANKNSRIINSGLWGFITSSYVDTQTLAIRKLTDTRSDVVSLIRMIHDLKENADNISRESYLHYHKEKTGAGDEKVWQKCFDSLCDNKSTVQNSSDTVSLILLNQLETKILDSCQDIKTHVNKFVAHADNKKSIDGVNCSVSFNRIENAQKIICQIYSFFSLNLYGKSLVGLIPEPQYQIFEGLENAFITATDCVEINKFWDTHNDRVNQWLDSRSLSDFFQSLNQQERIDHG